MLRIILSLLIGAAVTLGLFAFMAKLIENDARGVEEPESTPVIDIISEPHELEIKTINKPPVVEPVTPPPPTFPDDIDPPEGNPGPTIKIEQPALPPADGPDLGLDGMFKGSGEAQPIVRVEPRYPAVAAREGISGYVVMQFDIQPDGSTSDIEVIEANPKRTFNNEAVRALKKWKYRPKLIDGKTVVQQGQTVRLDFTLENQ